MELKKILIESLSKSKTINEFLMKLRIGKSILKDKCYIKTKELTKKELAKSPSRSEVINQMISLTKAENYLEIGVRNPKSNFAKINCKNKYAIDPGMEEEINTADFKVTSDVFFELLEQNKLGRINNNIKFDLIFIDGLHISNQVEKDIVNSLKYLKEDGFIVLHDCNPPTEYHQREDYNYKNSPASTLWNGTTWKAFYKFRFNQDIQSICFDCDWGVGVLTKQNRIGFNNLQGKNENEFYEFDLLDKNRKAFLNLQSFNEWKELVRN